ncbi:MAG: acyltransferase [Actinobacteria bacterium]|nr:acyltransferase [Actinomycetota bacterium]
MPVLDRLLRRLLAPAVASLVAQALAEARYSGPDGHDPELFHQLVYPDPGRVHVHPTAVLNDALLNVSSGDITIGPYTFLGHRVSLLTGTHDFSRFGAERQVAVPKTGRDIVIGEGVWLASHVIVVGPCTIGDHAVVGVGSLVLKDVAPYTVTAGSPATVRATIPRPGPGP